eukprot:TRINITY_DN5314_c0_g1_i1.p1 TRINITY_DN5314_c0_g1~~TRINITY_DN5314_c0_g1_i1.p1  ORF type:complete len:1140 (+),score=195.35 TRINITY_DN5314_c0_g1_i1:252-3422(+)
MSMEHFTHEATMMRKSCHANVLRMKGSFLCGNGLWLVLQYHPHGSILDVINSVYPDGISDETFICAILQQALEGLRYFHSIGSVHRDLKCANLLVSRNGDIRLSDFGISVPDASITKGQTFAGSPCWMAPEALSQGGYQSASDIWSLGITALECAFGKPPHHKHKPVKVFSLVLRGEPPTMKGLSPVKAKKFSADFHDFVKKCLKKDPKTRPTADELLKHPIFAGFGRDMHLSAQAYVRMKMVELSVPELVAKEVPRNHMANHSLVATNGNSGGGVNGHMGDARETETSDWDFPCMATAGAPSADEEWRSKLAKKYTQELGRYEKHGVMMQSGRLTVYLATAKEGDTSVALHEYEVDVHEYSTPILTDQIRESIFALSHHYILSCKGLWEDGKKTISWVTESKSGGSLAKYVATTGALGGGDAQRVACQLIQAVTYFHGHNSVHGQLHSHHVYLIDLSKIKVDVCSALIVRAAWSAMETKEFILPANGMRPEAILAPEVFEDGCSKESDIYGIGMIMLNILSGRMPFREFGAMKIENIIHEKISGREPATLGDLSFTWRGFVSLCINKNRPSLNTLLEHTALQGAILTMQQDDPQCTIATCPACLGPPKDSRKLDCGHCLCFPCAEQAHQFTTKMHSLLRATSGWAFGEPSKSFVCPQCGVATTLTDGIESLPSGVIKVPLCDHCEDKPAETECEQCMVTMCTGCSTQLHRRGRFKNHVVKSLLTQSLDKETVEAGEVIDRLNDRAEILSKAADLLEQSDDIGSVESQIAIKQVESWGERARVAVTNQEAALIAKIEQLNKTRETTNRDQLQLVSLLKTQIDRVLCSDPVARGSAVSSVALRRFNSLLATPCASDPQKWNLSFFGDQATLTNGVAKLSSVGISSSQLSWTTPPGPNSERAARAVVTLAALIACHPLLGTPKPAYKALRVKPKGLLESCNWRVRQLLVFSASGANLAVDPTKAASSPSEDAHEAGSSVGPAGSWHAAPNTGDSAWLEYRMDGVTEACTVVVRSYPQKEHCPEYITLEGSLDGVTYSEICVEEVLQSGTACWDCIISC